LLPAATTLLLLGAVIVTEMAVWTSHTFGAGSQAQAQRPGQGAESGLVNQCRPREPIRWSPVHDRVKPFTPGHC
jgi:hypothetical protein